MPSIGWSHLKRGWALDFVLRELFGPVWLAVRHYTEWSSPYYLFLSHLSRSSLGLLINQQLHLPTNLNQQTKRRKNMDAERMMMILMTAVLIRRTTSTLQGRVG